MVQRLSPVAGQFLCLAFLACEHPVVVPLTEQDASRPFADAANDADEDSGSNSSSDAGTDSGRHSSDAASDSGVEGSSSGGDAGTDSGRDGDANSNDAGANSEKLDAGNGAAMSNDAALGQGGEICRAACATLEHLPCYPESCVDDCLTVREAVPACAELADAFQRCKTTLSPEDSACDAEGSIIRTTEKCQAELEDWQVCFTSQP